MIFSGVTRKTKKNEFELEHQIALFQWARNPAVLQEYPCLDLLSCSLNGIRISSHSQRVKAKKSGMLKGEYDIKLPVSRGGYIGLIIEMKYGKNTLTDDQEWYGMRMREEGHFVCECWDWIEAKEKIIYYLELVG